MKVRISAEDRANLVRTAREEGIPTQGFEFLDDNQVLAILEAYDLEIPMQAVGAVVQPKASSSIVSSDEWKRI